MSTGSWIYRSIRNGWCHDGITRFCVCALAVALLAVGPSLPARPLLTPPELARAGVPSLALQLLEQQRPDYAANRDGWLHWKRLQVKILRDTHRWKRLTVIDQGLPEGLSVEFREWLSTQRAMALLQLGRSGEARSLLRRLIWRAEPGVSLEQWRQLVIRSYLAEGRRDDAYIAMLRYLNDYESRGGLDRLLSAKVYLGSGRVTEAKALLDGVESSSEVAVLRHLTALRSGEPGGPIRTALDNELAADGLSDRQLGQLWGVKAELEQREGKLAAYLIALESALQLRDQDGNGGLELFDWHADHLWQAYFDYAQYVANREQLLIGNDEAWFESAEEAGKRYPVKRTSLYAWLSRYASTPAARQRAHHLLIDALQERDEALRLLSRLYLDGSQFTESHAIPDKARYLMAGQAIKQGELTRASWLMQGLERPPEGIEPFLWQLRRARVFTLAGEAERGAKILHQQILDTPELSTEWVDKLVKNLFDLQTIGEHELAYQLLRKLSLRVADPKQQRELLYWMADSRLAQKRYAEAGRLYLQSAILPGPLTMDPWAQTARYQAAKALTEARLHDDAYRLFKQLLRVTTDPTRRAVLLRDIERLSLYRGESESSP